jgi:hypothetical protein
MTDDPAKALIHDYLASRDLDTTASYLNRGRAHQDLSDEALQAACAVAFQAMVADVDQADLLMDLCSECGLRGLNVRIPVSANDLRDLTEKVSAMGAFSEEAEEAFTQELDEFARAKTATTN